MKPWVAPLTAGCLGKNQDGKAGKREYRSESPVPIEGLSHFAVTIDAPTENFSVSHNGKGLTMSLKEDDLAELKLPTNPKGQAILSEVSHLPVAPRFLSIQRFDRVLEGKEIAQLAKIDASVMDAMSETKAVACSIVAREGKQNPSHVLIGGAYDVHGDEVTAVTPAALPAMPDSLPRNRLGFAEWLFLPENPLTARVAVNRIWAQFFGEGFVKTQNVPGPYVMLATTLLNTDEVLCR